MLPNSSYSSWAKFKKKSNKKNVWTLCNWKNEEMFLNLSRMKDKKTDERSKGCSYTEKRNKIKNDHLLVLIGLS